MTVSEDPTTRLAFAAELRAARKAKRWTTRELHRRSGVSESYIRQLEKGEHVPGLERVKLLEDALGATLSAKRRPTSDGSWMRPALNRVMAAAHDLNDHDVERLALAAEAWRGEGQ